MSDQDRIAELQRWIGIIVDAAVDQGNGESLVTNDDLEDAKAVAFKQSGDSNATE